MCQFNVVFLTWFDLKRLDWTWRGMFMIKKKIKFVYRYAMYILLGQILILCCFCGPVSICTLHLFYILMCVLVYVCMYVCYGYISSYHHSCISSVIHLITSSTSSLLLLSFNAFHWLFLSFSDSLSLLDGSQLVCVFSILCIISIRFYLILLSSFLWPGYYCGPL